MSNRSLLVVALVALAFCVYLYFKGGEPGTLAREEEAARLIILKPESIQRIELTNPSGTYVFQKAAEGKWDMEKPVRFPVDPGAISTFLSELENATKLRVIQPRELGDYQAAMQQFGLKDPRIMARFQSGGEVVELQVGGKTPSGNLYYAIVRDPKKQDLTVVDDVIESLLMQNLDLWRNPQIFDFTGEQATALLLRKGSQEVEVVKDGKVWSITKPLKEEAVEDQVQAFLSVVSAIRAENFVSETGSDPAQFGLNTPAYTLEVKLGGKSQILRVGKARVEKPGQVYAQFGDRPAVFTISGKQADAIGQLLEAVRPKSLFSLGAGAVVRTIEITQGGSTLVLQLKEGTEDDWTVRGEGVERKANPLGTQDMITAMHGLQAENFYSSVDNPNAEYGLQKPAAIVKISGDDPTAKDKAFERKVVFGAAKDNLVYAQSSVLPFVVDVDRRFLAAFPKGVYGWFDPSLGLPGAEEITGLAWKQDSNGLALARGSDGKWVSVPPGKPIDEKFLKVQVPYLSGLRVLRWAGRAVKKDFAKPRFALEIKAGGRTRELLFGPKQSDGTTLAKMADDDFAFFLSAEDALKVMVRPIPSAPVTPVP